jgi:malonyl-CoA O-methyltransferase
MSGDPALRREQGFDLIWSNMSLHLEPDPPSRFVEWAGLLAPEGFLMFSCLGPGTLVELRQIYAKRRWGEPCAAFVDMHDLGDMMVRAGLADPVTDQETLTLTWPDPVTALAELQRWGANAAPRRFPGLRTPRWRTELLDEIGQLAQPDGRIALSFEVVYGHAFRSMAEAERPRETRVGLDEMRELIRAARRSG